MINFWLNILQQKYLYYLHYVTIHIWFYFREFLKEIEECDLDPVSVANTFIKHKSGFKVYTEYCTNYPR